MFRPHTCFDIHNRMHNIKISCNCNRDIQWIQSPNLEPTIISHAYLYTHDNIIRIIISKHRYSKLSPFFRVFRALVLMSFNSGRVSPKSQFPIRPYDDVIPLHSTGIIVFSFSPSCGCVLSRPTLTLTRQKFAWFCRLLGIVRRI
jgi:hypothetical protein